MQKDVGSFIVAVFIAPVIGIGLSNYLLFELAQVDLTQGIEGMTRACLADPSPALCGALQEFRWLKYGSIGALAATILLPLGYMLVLLMLAGKRAALAHGFPILVRVCLALLPLILVCHALLVGAITWEAMEYGLIRRGYLALFLAAIAGALLLAAFNILTDMGRLLAIEPLRVTGIVLDEKRLPDLYARVRRIAQKLEVPAPGYIVVGIEPMVFMTSMSVKLRGVGDMPEGETLYVSALALRTLDPVELDGLLAYELAHFRAEDLAFSRRFAPAQAALVSAVESVEEDKDEHMFMKLAKAPAYGLLSVMLLVLRWRMKKVTREREGSADQAALAFAPAQQLVPMIVKMTALGSQWTSFRAGLANLMNRGIGRRNIADDYLRRVAASPLADLTAWTTPHPLDNHLTLAERLVALGVEGTSQIAAAMTALRASAATSNADLVALEEEVTGIDLDYTRVPGHPIRIAESTELPAELAAGQ